MNNDSAWKSPSDRRDPTEPEAEEDAGPARAEARFSELVREPPRFALTVMQILSRRLRAMDRRYRRPEPLVAREPFEP
jgi:hypothetical protein